MTTEEQRIAFAEEMGKRVLKKDDPVPDGIAAMFMCETCQCGYGTSEAPDSHIGHKKRNMMLCCIEGDVAVDMSDPFTNANDAEAIIEYMRGKDCTFDAQAGPPSEDGAHYWVHFYKLPAATESLQSFEGTGQNMRQAICAAFAAYIQSKQP